MLTHLAYKPSTVLEPLWISGLVLLLLTAGSEVPLNHATTGMPGSRLLHVVAAGLLVLLLATAGLGGQCRRVTFWVGLVLLIGLPCLYLLNASHVWRDGVGLVPVAHWRWLPATAYSVGTRSALWLSAGVAAALGTPTRLSERGCDILIRLIVAGSLILSVVVLCQRYGPRPFAVHPWTGIFVSRNHFAALACLGYPVAVASGIRLQSAAYRRGRLSSPAGLLYVASGLMALAVHAVGSRAGIGIVALQTLLLGVFAGWHTPAIGAERGGDHVRFARGRLLLLVLGVGGYAMASARAFRSIAEDLAFRGALWRNTLALWRSRPTWGSGPASFSAVFPYYQSDALGSHYFHHAHSDPLQFLAEYGVLGGGVTLIAAVLVLRGGYTRIAGSSRDNDPAGWLQAGLAASLLGVLLHSLVDFPLQHPLVLLLSCSWVSVLANASVREGGTAAPRGACT